MLNAIWTRNEKGELTVTWINGVKIGDHGSPKIFRSLVRDINAQSGKRRSGR